MGKIVDINIRFWAKVDKDAPGGCWVWTANRVWGGYGHIRIGARMVLAHRVSYEMSNGKIPDGKQVDHICHNRSCVNPGHLRLASNRENAHNMSLKSTNTSGFKGVSLCKRLNKWKAQLRKDGKDHYLGLFATPEEAHAAYCSAADKMYGEFANYGAV